MRGYIKSIAEFLQDDLEKIVNNLEELYPNSSDSQISAWKTLVSDLKDSIKKSNLTRDAIIGIEYELPTSGMGIDVLICGIDSSRAKTCYIIESKQWNDYYISSRVFSNYREDERELHPQIQVSRHKLSFCDYTDCGGDYKTTPFVFVRNCSHQGIDDLIARNPIESTKNIKIVNKLDDIIKVAEETIVATSNSIIEEIKQATYKPSKNIISAMQSILNREEPFILNDEQVEVVSKIKHSIKEGKKVIRITGPAGSGKTAILLNLYIELLSGNTFGENVSPVFVPGAQNTAFYKSKYPRIQSSFEYSFSLKNVIPTNGKNKYFILMDEAQHNQAGIITDIMDKGATIIFCYDVAQVINANNAIRELKQIENRDDFCSIELKTSARYNGSQVAENNIRNYIKGINKIEEDSLFDFRVFNEFSEFQSAVVSTINQHSDSTVAVVGLLSNDSKKYTVENNPQSMLYTEWGYKTECKWLPYVRDKNYFGSKSKLWVGTWWMPGLDVDYIAVIIGADAIRTSQGIVGVPSQSKHYQMLISVAKKLSFPENLFTYKINGYKKTLDTFASTQNILNYIEKPENVVQKESFINLFSQLLRNNYYIMMTRAQKGCFVYFAKDTTRGENNE